MCFSPHGVAAGNASTQHGSKNHAMRIMSPYARTPSDGNAAFAVEAAAGPRCVMVEKNA